MIMNQVFYKSVLMGADKISDLELEYLGIDIVERKESGTRNIIIPLETIEEYKQLVKEKLDKGFWNDIVGEDLIHFIFKMPDGGVVEFVYKEEDRLEIAELCSQLNGDSIEKTSDLLNYIGENEFYTDEVEIYKIKHQE
jgi:hypothetical protein